MLKFEQCNMYYCLTVFFNTTVSGNEKTKRVGI